MQASGGGAWRAVYRRPSSPEVAGRCLSKSNFSALSIHSLLGELNYSQSNLVAQLLFSIHRRNCEGAICMSRANHRRTDGRKGGEEARRVQGLGHDAKLPINCGGRCDHAFVCDANEQSPRREVKALRASTTWPQPPISHSGIAARPPRTGRRFLIMMCGPPGSSSLFFWGFFSTHIWQR